MFKNLKAEMKTLKITQKELAKVAGCTENTLLLKIRGDYDWKLSEMRRVQKYIFEKASEAPITPAELHVLNGLDWLFEEPAEN